MRLSVEELLYLIEELSIPESESEPEPKPKPEPDGSEYYIETPEQYIKGFVQQMIKLNKELKERVDSLQYKHYSHNTNIANLTKRIGILENLVNKLVSPPKVNPIPVNPIPVEEASLLLPEIAKSEVAKE